MPPQSIVENLILELPVAKLDVGTMSILKSYLACLLSEPCFLKADDFDRIVKALLSNEDLKAYQKSKLLFLYAEYHADYMNNIKEAIAVAVDALVTFTSHKGFVVLSQYYERGGYLEEMKRNIDMLEYTDTLGRYSKFIRETRERVNSQHGAQ